jgi:hypothetical protein
LASDSKSQLKQVLVFFECRDEVSLLDCGVGAFLGICLVLTSWSIFGRRSFSAAAPKGSFAVMGEKLQTAADYTGEKLQKAGTALKGAAESAKEKVVSTAQAAEHAAASGMRAAADKIEPKIKNKD